MQGGNSRPQDLKTLKGFKRLRKTSKDFMRLQETSGDFSDFTAEVSLFPPWNNAYSSIGCLFSSNKTNSDT
jgi:hypothetical protein